MDSFFRGFPDFRKPGNERIPFVFPACILCHHDLIVVCQSDDDCRRNLRKNHIVTDRTLQHALRAAVYKRMCASAAELIIPVPHIQMPCRCCGKYTLLRFHGPDRKQFMIHKSRNFHIFIKLCQIKRYVIHGKQIYQSGHFFVMCLTVFHPHVILKKCDLPLVFQINRPITKCQYPAVCIRFFHLKCIV